MWKNGRTKSSATVRQGLEVRFITARCGTLDNLSSLILTVLEPEIMSAALLTSPNSGKYMRKCKFMLKFGQVDKHNTNVSCPTL